MSGKDNKTLKIEESEQDKLERFCQLKLRKLSEFSLEGLYLLTWFKIMRDRLKSCDIDSSMVCFRNARLIYEDGSVEQIPDARLEYYRAGFISVPTSFYNIDRSGTIMLEPLFASSGFLVSSPYKMINIERCAEFRFDGIIGCGTERHEINREVANFAFVGGGNITFSNNVILEKQNISDPLSKFYPENIAAAALQQWKKDYEVEIRNMMKPYLTRDIINCYILPFIFPNKIIKI